jgi:hypothetical protein
MEVNLLDEGAWTFGSVVGDSFADKNQVLRSKSPKHIFYFILFMLFYVC